MFQVWYEQSVYMVTNSVATAALMEREGYRVTMKEKLK